MSAEETSQPVTVSAEDATQAEIEKNRGNTLFAEKHWRGSITAYEKAIKLNPGVPSYYTNLSFAQLKVEEFGNAMVSASKAIELDPKFVKGYYRRASAALALGHYKDAEKDFQKVLEVAPGEKEAQKKLTECRRQIKQTLFWKAIASEDPVPLSERLNPAEMIVPTDYTGPSFETDSPTEEFVREMMESFKNRQLIDKKYAFKILLAAKRVFMSEPNVVSIDVPSTERINVCGDVHGQYFDLLHIFKLRGYPSETNRFLFNGDFVDRGSFSTECILTLLAWKCVYPKYFFMSRGNHEARTLNQVYGFEGEVKAKYSDTLFDLFQELFNVLPLCSLINQKVFVVHGGLFSRNDVTIGDINKINRKQDIPEEGLMCEMLWSDPMEGNGRAASKRGVGVAFGPDVTENFLRTNDLKYIIRSHEVKEEGYTIEHGGKLITVFSAPNYCDQIGNKAAVFSVSGADLTYEIQQFESQPHPDVKPMQYSRLMPFGGLGF